MGANFGLHIVAGKKEVVIVKILICLIVGSLAPECFDVESYDSCCDHNGYLACSDCGDMGLCCPVIYGDTPIQEVIITDTGWKFMTAFPAGQVECHYQNQACFPGGTECEWDGFGMRIK